MITLPIKTTALTVLDKNIRRLLRGAAGVRELKISTLNFVNIFISHCHLTCLPVFWKL